MKHGFRLIIFARAAGIFLTVSAFAEETNSTKAHSAQILYENNFEKMEVGKLPADFLVQAGEFVVKEIGGNKALELPGVPLEAFSLFFGPAENSEILVAARIFGTSKGRRAPTFGVGLNGPSGYRLQISPGKKILELYKNDELCTSVPYEWKSGEWTMFKLQIRRMKEGEWNVEGKAWVASAKEPGDWMLVFTDKTEPITGRASIWGSPFSGTPIQFDDLTVYRVATRP